VTTTSGAFANSVHIVQKIENFRELRGRAISVSFRVKAAAAATAQIVWFDGIAGGGAWQLGPSTAITTNYQTLTLTFTPSVSATAAYVSLAFLTVTTFYVDNAMLVVGAVPADYAPLHPADDLARCLRYYEIIAESAQGMSWGGYGTAGMGVQVTFLYRARKPLTPTITKGAAWSLVNCSQPSQGTAGADSCYFATTVTAAGAYQFYNGSANALILEANP
jgi:hypothetical protein